MSVAEVYACARLAGASVLGGLGLGLFVSLVVDVLRRVAGL